MRIVASGRAGAWRRDCVRKGHVLLLEQSPKGSLLATDNLVAHCSLHLYLSSGGCRIMPVPGDVSAAVRRWYATNGQRPVKRRGKVPEEQKLARDLCQLLKKKSTCSFAKM